MSSARITLRVSSKHESYAKHTNMNSSCHKRNLQSREVEQMKSKANRQPDFPHCLRLLPQPPTPCWSTKCNKDSTKLLSTCQYPFTTPAWWVSSPWTTSRVSLQQLHRGRSQSAPSAWVVTSTKSNRSSSFDSRNRNKEHDSTQG
jgi:Tfp pilus assembly protein PilX